MKIYALISASHSESNFVVLSKTKEDAFKTIKKFCNVCKIDVLNNIDISGLADAGFYLLEYSEGQVLQL